jgi:membrane associated rhomboid family serine protease
MIIPWNTDAPIYHFPFVTIGLIVINTDVFFATLQSENAEQWMLAFGDGLQPYQWVTSVFMHADLGHLLGNMIFLWGFGLVIEGKLGWWRFLLVYLGLGIVQSTVVQICMQHELGYALGASGAIYGLLAMALIWAPRNEMNCVGLFGVRVIHLDIPILAFVTLYVGWEVVTVWMNDFAMSSAMLHLAGALPGFALATVMLKWGAVDCENWDVFAVLQNREGRAKGRKPDRRKAAANQKRLADQKEAAFTQFNACLARGSAVEALALHERMSQTHRDWQLTQPQLLQLIKALHKQQLWSQSVEPMVAYLRAASDAAPRVRLSLAQILVIHEKRPGRALSVLEKIPQDALGGDLRTAYDKLERLARKAYAEGDLEPEGNDW